MPPTRADFTTFVDQLGLRHFSADEILVHVGAHPGGVDNPVPERELWPNVVPTILVLDALRAELGAGIRLNSGYRAPDYNRSVNGVAGSQHQDFRALDFACGTGAPSDWAAVLQSWRGRPFASPVALGLVARHAPLDEAGLRVNETAQGTAFVFAGGIGVYNTFVHVDCRGVNQSWSGST